MFSKFNTHILFSVNLIYTFYVQQIFSECRAVYEMMWGNIVDCVWNVMPQAQKTDFVFRRNGRVHLIRRGRQFSRLLAAEVCASAVVMLDTPCFEVVWRVLATHSIRPFPLNFSSRARPCAITFLLDCTARQASDHTIIRRMRTVCSKTWGYRHTHRIFNTYWLSRVTVVMRTRLFVDVGKSVARPGRKQATATEDFEFHISYL